MINQYFPSWAQLPNPGDIRELADRRGKVQHLARVSSTDPGTRQAKMEILRLDRSGKEKRK